MALKSRDERGQGTVEYILILTAVVFFYSILLQGMKRLDLNSKLMQPLTQDFAATYQYGHPKAKGIEQGGANHPRVYPGENSFRLFLNPSVR